MFLGLFPVGWEDRGNVNANYIGNDTYQYLSCDFCKTKARIGLEDGERFLFCPTCDIKLRNPNAHTGNK